MSRVDPATLMMMDIAVEENQPDKAQRYEINAKNLQNLLAELAGVFYTLRILKF